MPTKRVILDHLTAKELRAAVDGHELHVDDRRVKAQLVDALAGSRKVGLADVLPELSRNRLKELCRVFGLDDSGRKKADIVARLVGADAESKSDGPRAKPAATRPAAPRPAAGTASPKAETHAATTGHEAELWRMADALRGSMDAAEYKHVVLGLVFLKYISDAFEEMHARLEGERDQGADPEDPDEYRAENIFWVPPEARWSRVAAQARQPAVGRLVDDAMAAIERDNPALADVLPRDYARPALDRQRLGQLIDMVGNIRVGDADARSRTCSAASTSTSSPSSRAPRARRAASSTPRAVWSGSWSRCWSPGAGGCTTRAAARPGCSCSRWSSSARTPPATGTAVGRGATSPSTVRSRTTRRGGSRR